MRYVTIRHAPTEVDARQWTGPYGDVTVEELREWGAPIVADFTDTGTGLVLTSLGVARTVPSGSWIIHAPPGHGTEWQVLSAHTFASLYVEAPDGDTDEDPFPGMESAALKRVAFRRMNAGQWEWRHAGLTKAELRSGGWTALYELTTGAP